MADTGWKNPTSAFNDDIGKVSWISPENALISDNTRAECNANAISVGDYLRCVGFFSATDIPAGATINGIEVQVEKQAGNSNITDFVVTLHSGGVDVGDNKALLNTSWSINTDAVQAYGGAADLWGTTLIRSDLIDAGFGVRFQLYNAAILSKREGRIDNIQCKVYYTPASLVKIWNGTSWVLKPLQRWDGSAWKAATLKRWNGSSWVSV